MKNKLLRYANTMAVILLVLANSTAVNASGSSVSGQKSENLSGYLISGVIFIAIYYFIYKLIKNRDLSKFEGITGLDETVSSFIEEQMGIGTFTKEDSSQDYVRTKSLLKDSSADQLEIWLRQLDKFLTDNPKYTNAGNQWVRDLSLLIIDELNSRNISNN